MRGWFRSSISTRSRPLTGLLLALLVSTDTIRVRRVEAPPAIAPSDMAELGQPALRVGPGAAAPVVWLLRAGQILYVHCWIPDSTASWNDEVVVSLDLVGDAAARPQHDDFQWELRRTLDSSVVYRGRANRWEPPRGDPYWRLGRDHSGGGWSVSSADGNGGWWIQLRLEGPWLEGRAGSAPRFAIRVRDADAAGWAAWPDVSGVHPSAVEGSPAYWVPLVEETRDLH